MPPLGAFDCLDVKPSRVSVTLLSANESGETPLDIAKRLRHEHCEELVSLVGTGQGPFRGQAFSGS